MLQLDVNVATEAVLHQYGLVLTEENFLICTVCQSFISHHFQYHLQQGCPTRSKKHVNAVIVERVNRELHLRDFTVPAELPCPPFLGVKCINGLKCGYCNYCSATAAVMVGHLKSSHPDSDNMRNYSACICQPSQAGSRSPLFPVTHRPEDAPLADLREFAFSCDTRVQGPDSTGVG